jgi:hypothetical protein
MHKIKHLFVGFSHAAQGRRPLAQLKRSNYKIIHQFGLFTCEVDRILGLNQQPGRVLLVGDVFFGIEIFGVDGFARGDDFVDLGLQPPVRFPPPPQPQSE